MKRISYISNAIVIALLLAGCNAAPPDTSTADAQALRDLEAQWNRDYGAKDVEKIMSHYADDAVLMGPGMPVSNGKAAVRKTIEGMVSDPALVLKFQATKVEVGKSGDVGYTQGSYTMTATDPNSKQAVNDHGSYVTTYRKQADGSWKAVADIATSEVPPGPPAAAAAPTEKK